MQLGRRESVDALTETVIGVLLTLFQIVGTILRIAWILVTIVYRSAERLEVVANRGVFKNYYCPLL
jgi:hypothetical protein